MRIRINRFLASEDASILKPHSSQANRKQAREKGERKRQTKKRANIFVNFCFSEVGERKTRGKQVNARDEFATLSWMSSAPEILPGNGATNPSAAS